MSDCKLETKSPLDGLRLKLAGATISEIVGRSMVSLAVPLGREQAAATAVRKAYGVGLPKPGTTAGSKIDNAMLVWMSADQFFVLFDGGGPNPVAHVQGLLGAAGYLTDQSDGWVLLELKGPMARTALERICPIDLDPGAFPKGRVARTAMEHIGAVVIHTNDDGFLLLSPRSSARSFAHAVETSARNVI